jgi:hypothetical protein
MLYLSRGNCRFPDVSRIFILGKKYLNEIIPLHSYDAWISTMNSCLGKDLPFRSFLNIYIGFDSIGMVSFI